MPSSIELNIGHVPSPRRARSDDGDEAPLRVVVLGDFSGRPAIERPALAQRRGARVDIDNLDAVFSRLAPVATIAGLQDGAGAPLRIALDAIDDFSADAVLARLPAEAMARLAAARRASAPAPAPAPSAPAAASDEDAGATLRRLLGGSVAADSPARSAPAPATPAAAAGEAIDRFIRQLAGGAASTTASAPAPAAPQVHEGAAVVLREVLRDPSWRGLEGAWRAVDRFVRELDMADGRVRLELVDVRADELLGDLAATGGDPARSALAGALAGDGRGCDVVVSLEEFGPSVMELSLLGGLALLAGARGAVLLAGAAPALAAIATSEDAGVHATPEARAWQALRASALAPRIGLTFPRLLARLPYGPRDEPVAAFAFDELEDTTGPVPHAHLAWRSAALDAALLLAQGYAQEGLAGVETRVELTDLPGWIDRRGDEPRLHAVAETYLGEAEARALQAAGFLTLQSDRRVPAARVSGWRSIAPGDGPLQGRWRDA
jgi:hypothetical protein